jgi:hypothetical protein
VDFLCSLFHALVIMNGPFDKTRAVVDAMERDMGTTVATKHDLSALATRGDLLELEHAIRLRGLRLERLRVELGKDLEIMELRLTLRLGALLAAGFGLVIATISATVAWLPTAGF